MRFLYLLPWFITLGATAPFQQLAAQVRQPKIVRVQVADSTGAPLEGADVTILAGLKVVDRGITDAAGRRVLLMSADTGDFQLIVRRLGFRSANQFFRPDARDTMSFAFYLPRVVQVLETVKVDAKQDRRHEFLFIDAATIASSGEDLDNAFDVMRKLRPRILKGWHTDFCGTGSDGLHGRGSIFGDRRSMSAPAELAPFPSDQ